MYVHDARTDIFLFRISILVVGVNFIFVEISPPDIFILALETTVTAVASSHFQRISSISLSVKSRPKLCVVLKKKLTTILGRTCVNHAIAMEKGKKRKTGVFLEPFEVISPLPKGIRFHVESKW